MLKKNIPNPGHIEQNKANNFIVTIIISDLIPKAFGTARLSVLKIFRIFLCQHKYISYAGGRFPVKCSTVNIITETGRYLPDGLLSVA